MSYVSHFISASFRARQTGCESQSGSKDVRHCLVVTSVRAHAEPIVCERVELVALILAYQRR